MKTKNLNKKIITIISIAVFAFIFTSSKDAKAGTCETAGGTCTSGNSKTCSTGYEYVGLYDCSDSAPNCCKKSTSTGTTTGTTTGSTTSSSFGNPIGSSTVEGVLASIMSYLKGIAGTIAVIFIIIGGVMYMLSTGDKDMAERAKKTLIYAMAGLAIVVAAPTFYSEIVSVLGGSSSLSSISGSSLKTIASNVLTLLLSIAGFLAIIMMVIGAIQMFSAMGEEERYEQGKRTVIYSIVGIVIVAASLVIATQIKVLIGG